MRLEDIQFLLALQSVTPPRNAVIVRQCPKSCAYAVGECLYNLLRRTEGLTTKEKTKIERDLLPFYHDLITLSTNNASLWNKKKALYRLAGKPLKTILKTAQPHLRLLEKIKRKEELKKLKEEEDSVGTEDKELLSREAGEDYKDNEEEDDRELLLNWLKNDTIFKPPRSRALKAKSARGKKTNKKSLSKRAKRTKK